MNTNPEGTNKLILHSESPSTQILDKGLFSPNPAATRRPERRGKKFSVSRRDK